MTNGSAPHPRHAEGTYTRVVQAVIVAQRRSPEPDRPPVADEWMKDHVVENLSPQGAFVSTELSERDQEILQFERQWWKYAGAKEAAIKELFDMSATRYYQVLNALIDNEAALAADPMLIKRLRRLRSKRQRTRQARRLGVNV